MDKTFQKTMGAEHNKTKLNKTGLLGLIRLATLGCACFSYWSFAFLYFFLFFVSLHTDITQHIYNIHSIPSYDMMQAYVQTVHAFFK